MFFQEWTARGFMYCPCSLKPRFSGRNNQVWQYICHFMHLLCNFVYIYIYNACIVHYLVMFVLYGPYLVHYPSSYVLEVA